jgi:predicted DNA binding CopG/RHH family protein
MKRADREEKELLESFEKGKWAPVRGKRGRVDRYRQYAEATFRKDRRINIRISAKDLDALKKRALEEGLPYQTLVSSVLHKYVSGTL